MKAPRNKRLMSKAIGQSYLQPPDLDLSPPGFNFGNGTYLQLPDLNFSPPGFDIPTWNIPGFGTSYVKFDPSILQGIQNIGTEVAQQGGTWGDWFKNLLQTGLTTATQLYLLKQQMRAMGKSETDKVTPQDTSALTTQLYAMQAQQQKEQQKMFLILGIGGLFLVLIIMMFTMMREK